MKILKTNFLALLGAKEQRDGRRYSLKQVARDSGVKEYTVYGFANNSLREYPADAIVKLCEYLNCAVGDLLTIEEVTEVHQ